MNSTERSILLKIARAAIESPLSGNKSESIPEDLPPTLKKLGASFVTLTIGGNLRGCIGNLTAVQPLYQDVAENAVNAAFNDPRFPPLSKEEFPRVALEISVLSQPENYKYTSAAELASYLQKNKPGLILQKGFHQATFLPQVWTDLPAPEDFLAHLCLKAGLAAEEWQKGQLSVFTYTVDNFSTNELND